MFWPAHLTWTPPHPLTQVQLICYSAVVTILLHVYERWRPFLNSTVHQVHTVMLYIIFASSFISSIFTIEASDISQTVVDITLLTINSMFLFIVFFMLTLKLWAQWPQIVQRLKSIEWLNPGSA